MSGEDRGGANFVRVGTPAENIAQDIKSGVVLQLIPYTTDYWSDALETCNALVADGKDDWRLATAKDLALLLDPPEVVAGRSIHPIFSITPGQLWTSSAVGLNVAAFDQIQGTYATYSVTSSTFGFRCARGHDLP